MGAGITITVTAEQAAAAAQLQQFFNNVEAGAKRIGNPALHSGAINGVKDLGLAAKTTGAGMKALHNAAVVLGFQVFPQFTSSVLTGTATLKAFYYGAKATGLGLMELSGVGLIVVETLGILTAAWAKYHAEQQEGESKTSAADMADRLAEKTMDRLIELRKANAISAELFGELSDRLTNINGGESLLDSTRFVLKKLRGVIPTSEEEKGAKEFFELQLKFIAESLEGFDRMREEEMQNWRENKQHIEEKAKLAGKAITDADVRLTLQFADEAHAQKMADIDKQEADKKQLALEKQRSLIEQIDQAHAAATQTKIAQLNIEEAAQQAKADKELAGHADLEKKKLQITATFAAKRAAVENEEDLKLLTERLTITRDNASRERNSAQNDFHLTEIEKREQVMDSLRREKAAVDALIESLKTMQSLQLTPEGRAAFQQPIQGLQGDSRGLGGELAGMQAQANPGSFRDQLTAGLVDLQNQWNIARTGAETALNAIKAGVQGVSDAIAGAIFGTATWGQVFLQVGRQIVSSIINTVVQWIAQMTIMAALKKIFGVQDNVQAAQSAAAWSPAAIAASIASYGAASAIGTAAFMAALATGTATASALSTGAGISGREFGGPVSAGTPYIVGERRPELFVPNTNGFIMPRVPDSFSGGSGAAAVQGGGQQRIIIVDSRAKAEDLMRDQGFKNFVVDLTRNDWKGA